MGSEAAKISKHFAATTLDQFIATLMEPPQFAFVEKTNNLYLKTDDDPISCYTQHGLASTYVKKEDGIFVETIKTGSQHQGLTFQVSASRQ